MCVCVCVCVCVCICMFPVIVERKWYVSVFCYIGMWRGMDKGVVMEVVAVSVMLCNLHMCVYVFVPY